MHTFTRWGLPPLVLVALSFVLFAMVGASRIDFTLDRVQAVGGTVSRYFQAPYDSLEHSVDPAHFVTLAERPQNVAFFLESLPPSGIAPGDAVRLELLDDLAHEFELARENPDNEYQVRTVGATVNGHVVHAAATTVERSETAIRTYSIGASVLLVVAALWAGLGAYRHRAGLLERLRADGPDAYY